MNETILKTGFKYTIIFLLPLLFGLESRGQNLIFNPDFELYDTCPTSISTPWDYQIQHCLGWNTPTPATSDYYNACAAMVVGVPSNYLGYQYAYSGNAYCGLVAFSIEPTHWWEYIQSKLNAPLEAGEEYKFSFRIVNSGGDNSQFAVWQIGALFTSTQISRNDVKPFNNYSPQVQNEPYRFLTDTVNWQLISGRFIAQGGEQYVTIGMFRDTASFDSVWYYHSPYGFIEEAYYFIDSLNLVKTDEQVDHVDVFTPNDDGMNDVWRPLIPEGTDLKIFIYNRWGNLLLESPLNDFYWNGKERHDRPCDDGTYYYVITGNIPSSNAIKTKGFIQLIR